MTFLLVVVTLSQGPSPSLVCPDHTEQRQWRYENTSLEEWCVDERGMRHGPQESRYANGTLLVQGSYNSGRKDGTWRYFFNNGVKWREDQWEFGRLKTSWVNPIVYTLTPEESEALGAGSCGGVIIEEKKNPR